MFAKGTVSVEGTSTLILILPQTATQIDIKLLERSGTGAGVPPKTCAQRKHHFGEAETSLRSSIIQRFALPSARITMQRKALPPSSKQSLDFILQRRISSLRKQRFHLRSRFHCKAKPCIGFASACRQSICLQADRGRESEIKFVNRHAEAYVDTPSADWQKHKNAVITA